MGMGMRTTSHGSPQKRWCSEGYHHCRKGWIHIHHHPRPEDRDMPLPTGPRRADMLSTHTRAQSTCRRMCTAGSPLPKHPSARLVPRSRTQGCSIDHPATSSYRSTRSAIPRHTRFPYPHTSSPRSRGANNQVYTHTCDWAGRSLHFDMGDRYTTLRARSQWGRTHTYPRHDGHVDCHYQRHSRPLRCSIYR